MSEKIQHTRALLFALAVCVVVICAIVLFPGLRVQAQNIEENIVFALHPSASLAFQYGERHFNGQEPSEYDLARAEYFFEQAAARNPNTPYLFHELARIAFLEGDLTRALVLINIQIALHGDSEPNSYYVRGLIEGYMSDYADSAVDYKYFLQFDPEDWAAMNDYAWVLLKANEAQQALSVTQHGVALFPKNPWLLNSYTIALYETGDLLGASKNAVLALAATREVTQAEWLHAYPGNDPQIAAEGVAALQKAAEDNMHMVGLAVATSTVQ